MAKLKIYTVYDSKVQAYGKPFILRSKGEALRGFMEVANDRQTEIGKYPADFNLFEIAEYDETTGQIIPHMVHENLGKALDLVKPIQSTQEFNTPIIQQAAEVRELTQ